MKILLSILLLSFCFSSALLSQTGNPADYFSEGVKLENEEKFLKAAAMFGKYIKNGKDQPDHLVMDAYLHAGLNYRYAGQLEPAVKYFEAGLKLARKVKVDSTTAHFLNNIGEINSSFGKNDSAMVLYNEAREIFRRTGRLSDEAAVLDNIGFIWYTTGQYDSALSCYSQALEIGKALKEEDHIATALNNIGNVYNETNRGRSALAYFEQALELYKKLKIEYEIPTELNNIASVYYNFGQYEKALLYLEEGLAVNRKLDQKDRIVVRLNNIGSVYSMMGELDSSAACLKEALDLARRIKYNDQIPPILNSLGKNYMDMKQYRKAIGYFKQALSMNRNIGRATNFCVQYNNIGRSYLMLRDFKNAEANLKKGMQNAEKFHFDAEMSHLHTNFGSLYLEKRDYKKAISHFNSAVEILEKIRLTASAAERRDYLASQIETYRLLITSHLKNNDRMSAIKTLELSSARLLSEQMGGRQKKDTLKISEINYFRKNINDSSAAVCFSTIGNNETLAAFLVTKDSIYADEMNINSFLDKLSPDCLAMIRNFNGSSRNNSDPKNIFNRGVTLYNNLLSKPNSSISEVRMQRELGGLLYSFLLGSFDGLISSKSDLTIMPGGILSLLPFETLRIPDGRFLAERSGIKYIQSLTVSELIGERKYGSQREPLLAFGGAVYGSLHCDDPLVSSENYLKSIRRAIFDSLDKGKNLQNFYYALGYGEMKDLPGTLQEVREIKELFSGSRIITGEDVRESAVKEMSRSGELKKYSVLHFAAHGIAVPDVPELSALVLSLKDSLNEDGFLNSREISELDLNADFVCLSACQTGLGKIYNGEGVVGLTQSFFIAGANSIAVSLWPLDDRAAVEFIQGMYRQVKEKGLSYDRALTEMKRKFIKSRNYSAPFYWSSFVYWGN